MTETDKIIREEINLILVDIKRLYEKSGKKVTGQFLTGLSSKFGREHAEIWGHTYLAGRGATRSNARKGNPTLREKIEQWIKDRAIIPRDNISISSLAFLIARKIHKDGTNEKYHFKIYEEVITPERMQKIINRVERLNINRIITEIRAELLILTKNV